MKKITYMFLFIVSTSLFAQNNENIRKMISVSARGITPIGIFSENWNTGGAAYFSFGWFYSKTWLLKFQTGYNRYRLKSGSDYSENPKLSMLPIQVGGRRYFLNGSFRPFAEAMTGVNFIRLFYKENDMQVDERTTHINFQIGGGVSYTIANNWIIEAAVMYNSHLINPSIPYNLTGFEYGLGVSWIFD